jgi:HD superfamily phosphohydrolase
MLRDSLHTGVAYGRFDHNRLIATLRIIPGAPEGGDGPVDADPQLGCERRGLESAEARMLGPLLHVRPGVLPLGAWRTTSI